MNTYEAEEGKRLPVLRNSTPPPCESCPKKSPENGEKLKLLPANEIMWDLYCRVQGGNGFKSTLFTCAVNQRNFAIIKNTIEFAKSQVSEKLASKGKKAEDDGGI